MKNAYIMNRIKLKGVMMVVCAHVPHMSGLHAFLCACILNSINRVCLVGYSARTGRLVGAHTACLKCHECFLE